MLDPQTDRPSEWYGLKPPGRELEQLEPQLRKLMDLWLAHAADRRRAMSWGSRRSSSRS
jgi:hypothetical protein